MEMEPNFFPSQESLVVDSCVNVYCVHSLCTQGSLTVE